MACVLTTSFALDCKDGIGGIKTVWVIANSNKGTYTKSTSGTVTAWTPTANSLFKYELRKATSMFEQDYVQNEINGTLFYQGKVTLKMYKMEVAKRNELKLLAQQNIMMIVLDRNGTYWVLGESNGLNLTSGKGTSGTAMGDFNGYDLEFSYEEEDAPAILTAGVVTSLGL